MKVLIALALLAPTSDAAGLRASRSRRLADQLDLSRLEEAAGEGRLGAGISFKLDGSHKMSLAGEKSRLATAVARRMDCGEATRLFRDAGKHEAAQKAAGLDLWYAVRCAAADGDETKEAKSQKTLKRLRRFLDSESHDGVAFIEPELEKTLTREDILPGFLAEQDERSWTPRRRVWASLSVLSSSIGGVALPPARAETQTRGLPHDGAGALGQPVAALPALLYAAVADAAMPHLHGQARMPVQRPQSNATSCGCARRCRRPRPSARTSYKP